MGDTPFTVLERVELAAREQRLAAAAQVETILAEARVRAAGIEARLPEGVAATVRDVRAEHAQAAAREIAAIEAQLRTVEQPAPGDATAAIEGATQLIVAAVLGETWPGGAAAPGRGAAGSAEVGFAANSGSR